MSRRWLSFGPFRLDSGERRLWRGSELIRLPPKPLALLSYLAERPGRLTTKSELLEAVWPDVNVADAVLKTCVAEIRQALGDDAAAPRWIETVPRHGYRFVAPLQYNNLPVRATSFIGRQRELREVKSLLGNSRLVTLLGAPGVGKSSLAIRLAADLLHELPHGVCWVDLAPLSHPDQIALSIANALAFQDHTGRPAFDVLIEQLADRELLIILDNCEHLLDACASLLESILQQCGRIVVLATSREPLGVDREIGWRVPPLSLPATPASASTVVDSEAVQLFVSRALHANPAFQLSDRNADVIGDICLRLDGMPLALELAAARVSMFDPAEIASRLDDALALLDNDGQPRTARRQTLSKMLEWSYSTLTPKERQALAMLTVFAGDFSLAAAESVCSAAGEIERRDVLSTVSRLVDKSMLVVVEQPDGVRTRFQQLQIVRQFARKQVAPELAPMLPRLLAEAMADFVEGLRVNFDTARREVHLAQISREYSNLRAALDWSCSDGGDAHLGLRIAGTIWPFWSRRGQVGEGLQWLRRLLARGPQGPPVTRALALLGMGVLLQSTGSHGEARGYLVDCVALSRTTDDPFVLAVALFHRARLANREGEPGVGSQAIDESISLLRHCPPGWSLALALAEKGIAEMNGGRLQDARRFYEEAASILRDSEDLTGLTVPLIHLAHLTALQGEHDRAMAYCREVLSILRPIDEHWWAAHTLEIVGMIRCAQREFSEAAQLLGAAERLRKIARAPWTKNPQTEYERLIATVRRGLSDAAFHQAWAAGAALSREDALLAAASSEPIAG